MLVQRKANRTLLRVSPTILNPVIFPTSESRSFGSDGSWSSAAGVRTYCKMTLTYSDDTTEDTNIRNVLGSGYLERSYTNPNLTKAVKKVEVYLYTTVSKTGYEKLTSLAGTITQNRIVQTNAITCVTGATHHQVYCKNTTAGTGTATYNISFDNGSTWDTTQAFNTLNNAGSTTGTQMILKLNLIGSLTPDTAEANNYGIMLFY